MGLGGPKLAGGPGPPNWEPKRAVVGAANDSSQGAHPSTVTGTDSLRSKHTDDR
jgi:hypothetical protein